MSSITRGTLQDPAAAPAVGERFVELATARSVVIEQILSSESDQPTPYLQNHDEWVVVLSGGATLAIDGEECVLAPGDWVMLPAEVPHTVVRTDAGTSWIAVHIHPAGS